MSGNSSLKRCQPDSPQATIPSKQNKSEISSEIENKSNSETLIISRDQKPTNKEDLEKLKAENAQLRTKLYHLENFVIPGKNLEVDKLIEKLTSHQTKIDKVSLEKESRQKKYKEVDFKLKETERALKAAVEKNEGLSSSFQVELREINSLQKCELESLKTELADKNLKLGEATKMCSELRLQLVRRLENHKLDIQSADTRLQEKEVELAKAQKKMEEIQIQFQEALQNSNDEKGAIRERAQKEAMDLVDVNLEHQKEIYQLRARLENLERGKPNPVDFEGEDVNEITITPEMEDNLLESNIATASSSIVDDINVSQAPIHSALGVLKPISCSICGKSYRTKQGLKIHQAAFHSSGPVQVYKCPFCGAKRKYRRDFIVHFKSVQTAKCLAKRPADFNYSLMVVDDYKITVEQTE